VVSRYADGRAASRYVETVWDWRPYAPAGKSSPLNFQFWPKDQEPDFRQEALLAEMHWVAYLLAWKRRGPLLSYQSLLHYVKALRAVARHCMNSALTIQEVFTRHDYLLEVVNWLPAGQPKQLSAILSALAELGPVEVGYAVLGDQAQHSLRALARQHADGQQQTPPLPTRIYSHVITTLLRELTDFEQVADRFLTLAARCATNPLLGRTKSIQWAAARRRAIPRRGFEAEPLELMEEYGLTAYFEARSLTPGVHGLSAGLSRLQTVCRLTVQVFTGMRDEEAGQLPYACLETSGPVARPHHVIVGATTKLNRGKPKAARWVTNLEGARAIAMAQRIADLCRVCAALRPALEPVVANAFPLFPSLAYIGLAGHRPRGAGSRMVTSKLDLGRTPQLRAMLQPAITPSDLRELERIDPHRAWRAEPRFQVGEPWTLTTHQLRRSLALYAQRSGLVSLPSLRRQLQHLTEEMSRYYARGSAFADDFIGKDKHHFGQEWRTAQPVSAALSYLINVIASDEELFGAQGAWIEKRLRSPDGTILQDRAATLRGFSKGELAYTETLLGGCISTKPCDIQPVKWLDVECIRGCRNMIGRVSKLERAIGAQTRLVDHLDPGTAEYRAEQADLQVLLETRERISQRTKESKP
jgi:hypothetical protein